MSSLKKAAIEITEGPNKGSKIEFLYNPATITYAKSVRWGSRPRPSSDVGDLDFGGGQPSEFNISEVLFDTTLPREGTGTGSGDDVRQYTDKLIDLMDVVEIQGDGEKIRRPPRCKFVWGSLVSFELYVTKVNLSFEMFSPNGTPVRAKANVSFMQATDVGNLPRQNPTSGSYARKIWTVLEGETLDWIAHQEYGDAAAWRHIAEVNNLADPLRLRPGQLLKLTPLD